MSATPIYKLINLTLEQRDIEIFQIQLLKEQHYHFFHYYISFLAIYTLHHVNDNIQLDQSQFSYHSN